MVPDFLTYRFTPNGNLELPCFLALEPRSSNTIVPLTVRGTSSCRWYSGRVGLDFGGVSSELLRCASGPFFLCLLCPPLSCPDPPSSGPPSFFFPCRYLAVFPPTALTPPHTFLWPVFFDPVMLRESFLTVIILFLDVVLRLSIVLFRHTHPLRVFLSRAFLFFAFPP